MKRVECVPDRLSVKRASQWKLSSMIKQFYFLPGHSLPPILRQFMWLETICYNCLLCWIVAICLPVNNNFSRLNWSRSPLGWLDPQQLGHVHWTSTSEETRPRPSPSAQVLLPEVQVPSIYRAAKCSTPNKQANKSNAFSDAMHNEKWDDGIMHITFYFRSMGKKKAV